jgi:alpha-tubulin suppressor-like RCC1 family protein
VSILRREGVWPATAAAILFLACGDPTDHRTPTLSITPTLARLTSFGETVQLRAEFRDRDGSLVSGKIVEWRSADPTVATVDRSGLVTALANGSSVVTATAEGLVATAAVEVTQTAAQLTIARPPAETFMDVVLTPAITVRIRDARGNGFATPTPVTLELDAPAGAGAIVGPTTLTAAEGVALFDVAVSRPGRGYRVRATGAGLTAVSEPFDILGAEQLSVGPLVSCALVTNGRIYCWGSNHTGQRGTPPGPGGPVPTLVPSDKRFTTLSVGGVHACAVSSDGDGYCWGRNDEGQAGTGTVAEAMPPTLVAGGHSWRSIQAGSGSSCGLTVSGKAYCWGFNNSGQLGDGTTTNRLAPVEVSGGLTFSLIDVWGSHTCGVASDGAAYCWGWNGAGQLGVGTSSATPSPVPARVAGGFQFRAVTVGGSHSCGLTTGAAPLCWGSNDRGQTGTLIGPIDYAPTAVASLSSLGSISAGVFYSCGLTDAGAAHCWGDNADGQLGDGTSERRRAPVAVSGGLAFARLDAGFGHTCGLLNTGAVYCWGANSAGQLGDGSFTGSNRPVRVVWRRAAAVHIDSVKLQSAQLSLSGSAVPYTIYVSNLSGAPLIGVTLQTQIDQGSSSSAAGGRIADCGEGLGRLGPGKSCVFSFTIRAIGDGLSVGPAVATFVLHSDNGATHTTSVPITITP